MEIWKDILNYEGLYQVSNLGRVKNSKGHIMTNQTDKGYQKLVLSKYNKSKIIYIHRAVLMAFIPIENMENLQVNHINGIKDDNRLENLEWVTNIENIHHSIRTGLTKHKGEDAPWSVLTWDDVHYIRKNYIPRHKEFSGAALARKFGVCQQLISQVITNKIWKEE